MDQRERLIKLIKHCTSCEECRDEDIADYLLANGVIVAVKLDAVQNKYSIADTIVFSNLLTKKELGFDYHMAAYGQNQDRNGDGIVKEWFEQAEAFEAWCVGKTIAEVAAQGYNHSYKSVVKLIKKTDHVKIGHLVHFDTLN